MSLNTATKRRSMVAIPGIGTLPVPDGSLDAANRRHIIDVYSGFGSEPKAFFFWRKRPIIDSSWAEENTPANVFVGQRGKSDSWVPLVNSGDASFVKEKKGEGDWAQNPDMPEAEG